MSDFGQTFAISASGMALERLRLEVAAHNLANAHTTRAADGRVFRPLRVIAHPGGVGAYGGFENLLGPSRVDNSLLKGVGSVEVRPLAVGPRLEHDPGHPDADEKGFVALPQINPVEEVVTVMTAVRAYEANVRVLNAAKTMAQKALEIGGGN